MGQKRDFENPKPSKRDHTIRVHITDKMPLVRQTITALKVPILLPILSIILQNSIKGYHQGHVM
jgi:hypothetical protein